MDRIACEDGIVRVPAEEYREVIRRLPGRGHQADMIVERLAPLIAAFSRSQVASPATAKAA